MKFEFENSENNINNILDNHTTSSDSTINHTVENDSSNGNPSMEVESTPDFKYEEKKESLKDNFIFKELMEYIKMIVVMVIVYLLLTNFLIINARIPSESMENTIMTGDQIFGNRMAYKFNDPERFDIVIFRFPDDESQLFIKRVIGLPGEKVEIRDGKVYINDSETALDDSFTPETPLGDFGPYEVPEDSYFMLGDNRNYSKDSRYWINQFVEKDKILGKAALRYWPITEFGLID